MKSLMTRITRVLCRLQPTGNAVNETGREYVDELSITRVHIRLWRSVARFSIISNGVLALTLAYGIYEIVQSTERTHVVLSPAVRAYEVATVNEVTDSYIKATFEKVALLNSSWTFETISENYHRLFSDYYSDNLNTLTKANLAQSDRIGYVEKNKMVSVFRIKADQSEYTWCKALNMACGLVVGKETVFTEGNQPYRESDIAFLVFGTSIFPTSKHNFALRIDRLVVGDPMRLRKTLEAAKKGELPDEINVKNQVIH